MQIHAKIEKNHNFKNPKKKTHFQSHDFYKILYTHTKFYADSENELSFFFISFKSLFQIFKNDNFHLNPITLFIL